MYIFTMPLGMLVENLGTLLEASSLSQQFKENRGEREKKERLFGGGNLAGTPSFGSTVAA
jgi:hypothetical protein